MPNFTIEIMETLINKGNLDDLFRRQLELAINTLLQAELTAFLIMKNMIVPALIQEIPVMGIIHVHSKQNMEN